MKRLLSLILSVCMMLSCVMIADVTTLKTEAATTQYNLADNVQDGQILQCWNWSFDNIKDNMEQIASQGFTAVQTSPIQPTKESTKESWSTAGKSMWVFYQPIGFTIEQNTRSALGTKDDFVEMCEEAHKYGVKVIVDTVFNHLANEDAGNTICSQIDSDIADDDNCWHSVTTDISNYSDRYDITHHCLGGLPDLNTGSSKIQNYAIDFMKECIDAGADGFRFDAAKHIETPSDSSSVRSDFWPNVLGAATSYAQSTRDITPYYYGELLDSPGGSLGISAYTEYMSVTDNQGSNSIRNSVVNGSASGACKSSISNGASTSKTVQWNESHDTYNEGSSSSVSDTNLKKTWAIVGSRAKVCGMYLARPSSSSTKLGAADKTAWADDEVREINKFKNAFVGESEYFAYSGSTVYVERGTKGVVLVNVSGGSKSVSVTANRIESGTYTDAISGNTFTVSNGKISGNIGSSGIAVVYNQSDVEEPTEMQTQAPTDEPTDSTATDPSIPPTDPPTEPTEATTEPETEEATQAPLGEAGYYVVGNLGGKDCWGADSLTEDRLLTDADGDGIYTLDWTFYMDDELKVVYFDGYSITQWYKDSTQPNYKIGSDSKTGLCTVSFDPTGKSGYSYTYFTVKQKPYEPTEPETEPTEAPTQTETEEPTEIATEAPTVEPTKEPTLQAGYYLVGTLNGEDCWTVDSLTEDRRFVKKDLDGNYVLDYTFYMGDELKVAYFDGYEITRFFKDIQDGDYESYTIGVVSKTGLCTVTFNPEGGDWSYKYFTVRQKIVEGQCGDNAYYTLDIHNGQLSITGSGDMYEYEMIMSPWSYNKDIKTIVIADGITNISNNVFAYCDSLTSITIPDSVNSIGYDAFYACSKLTAVTILNAQCEIGSYAIPATATIYGYLYSTAHKYANENGNVFVALDAEQPTVEPTFEPTEPSEAPTQTETETPTEAETQPTEAETEAGRPEKVANVVVESTTANTVKLSWDQCGDCFKYWVYMLNETTGEWTVQTRSGTTSAVVKNLSPNTTYKFKVTGKFARDNAILNVDDADIYEATTTVPAVPGSISAEIDLDQITVSWDEVEGARKYWLYKSTSPDGPYYISGSTLTNSIVVKKFAPDTTYYFKVTTLTNQNGMLCGSEVEDSPMLTVKTQNSDDIATKLVSNTATTVTISYPTIDTGIKYWVKYSTTTSDVKDDKSWTTVTSITDSSVNTYTLSKLSPDTRYYITVRVLYTDTTGAQKGYDFAPITVRTPYSDDEFITFADHPQNANYFTVTWPDDVNDVTKAWVYAIDAQGTEKALGSSTSNTLNVRKFDGYEDCYYEIRVMMSDGTYGTITPSGGEQYHN